MTTLILTLDLPGGLECLAHMQPDLIAAQACQILEPFDRTPVGGEARISVSQAFNAASFAVQ